MACMLSACDKVADTQSVAIAPPVKPVELTVANAAEKTSLIPQTDAEKISYFLGVNMASSVPSEVVTLETQFVLQGIEDVQQRKVLKLKDAEMQKIMHQYSLALQENQKLRQKTMEEEHGVKNALTQQFGEKLLADNRSLPNIVEAEKGVQYIILKSGNGKSPSLQDTVRVKYVASFMNSEGVQQEFDNSQTRNTPATYAVKDVVEGWQVILPLMKEGDHWKVFVPASLAYGIPGSNGGEIPKNAVVIYDMELVDVISENNK
jgi:FKBP-type peptidyl-prolyl cis-trans isomerase